MTAALIIDDQTQALIFAEKRRAEHNPILHERLEQEDCSTVQPVRVPMNYLARYAVEEHQPGQFFRHLIVSLTEGGSTETPHHSVVEEIMRMFKFHGTPEDVEGWLTSGVQGNSVHVLELMGNADWAGPQKMDQTQPPGHMSM